MRERIYLSNELTLETGRYYSTDFEFAFDQISPLRNLNEELNSKYLGRQQKSLSSICFPLLYKYLVT